MATREIRIGVGSFVRADSPSADGVLLPLWGFGLYGETVNVHEDDLERFDRLNGPSAAEPVPLPEDEFVEEPPRTGKGSGLKAWLVYAEQVGAEVPEGASRDDVIAAVDALDDENN